MRTDPFRELDRFAQRVLGTAAMPMLATERPRGVFNRQLVLGDNLDTERIDASYAEGVLRLRIPVSERAEPRKITVGRGGAAQALRGGPAAPEVVNA